jgi:uncharacterized protein (DUF849 family)
MVAPNGARRGTSAHPEIPLTDAAIVETAVACQQAGADGIHIHIRDEDGLHLLDADHYQALLTKLAAAAPGLYLQDPSESADRYDAATQRKMVETLKPQHVSVALREMVRSEADWPAATEFYTWAEAAGVAIQHIVYSTDELSWLLAACTDGRIPGSHHLLQLVLGTYDGTQISRPESIHAFVDLMEGSNLSLDWGLCAFGAEETACLVEAVRCGGKARVGFENSLWNADGSVATDNAARVREVRAGIDALG